MSFLPVCDALECQSLVPSSDVGGLSDDVEADGLINLKTESLHTWTSLWVQSGEDYDGVGDTVPDELDSQLSDDLDTLGDGVDNTDDIHVGPNSPDLQTETHAARYHVYSDQTSPVATTNPDGHQTSSYQHTSPELCLSRCDSDQVAVPVRVITRAGRVVKPVNRLIESMVHKASFVA